MAERLSNDDVLTILHAEVGDTGNAKIERNGLMIQKEENSRWMFHGEVADPAGAVGVIEDFFI